MKNLITRSLTGIVYVGLVISALYIGQWAFSILLLVFLIIGSYELAKLMPGNQLRDRISTVAFSASVFIAFSAMLLRHDLEWLFFLPFFVAALLVMAEIIVPEPGTIKRFAVAVLSCLYLAAPFFLLLILTQSDSSGFPGPIVLLFVVIWINDSLAYLIGKAIGRHKLAPSISPGKTWEGFLGALIITVLITTAFGNYIIEGTAFQLLGFALVTILAGTLGDLFQSKLKRDAGVKDSGSIFPGHGGVLDRLDSVIMASPLVWVYAMVFFHFPSFS